MKTWIASCVAAEAVVLTSQAHTQLRPTDGLCLYDRTLYIMSVRDCSGKGQVFWTSAQDPTRSDVVRLIQFGLKTFNLYDGAIDGIEGPQTRNGLKQRYGTKVKPSGEITEEVVDLVLNDLVKAGHLGAPAEDNAKGEQPKAPEISRSQQQSGATAVARALGRLFGRR